MECTHLQKVALLAYYLGDGEEGLQKTAGVFGTMPRLLRTPFRGPLRQIGKSLSEGTQQRLTGAAQRHALAAADPNTTWLTRWFRNWRASSAQKNLGKELGLHSKLLGADARSIQGRLDRIAKAMNTPGMTPEARKTLEAQWIRYQQQMAALTGDIRHQTSQAQMLGNLPPRPATPKPTVAPESTAEQIATGKEAGRQVAGGEASGAKPRPVPPPGTMPTFFEKYAPGTATRNVADYFFADPLKATALGLGGAWGLGNIVTPTVKNILGVQQER